MEEINFFNANKMDTRIEINQQMCRICFRDDEELKCDLEGCQDLIKNITQIQVSTEPIQSNLRFFFIKIETKNFQYFQLQQHPNFPENVCEPCYKMLEVANDIRSRCLESFQFFENLLDDKTGISVEVSDDSEQHETVYHHQQVLAVDQIYRCCMCLMEFLDEKTLLEHRWTEHNFSSIKQEGETTEYHCSLCAKSFTNQSTKEMHRTCTICLETCLSEEELVLHHEEVHQEGMETEYLEGEDNIMIETDLDPNSNLESTEDQTAQFTMDPIVEPMKKKRSYEKSAITIEREKNREKKKKAKYGCCKCPAESNTKVLMKEHFIEHHPGFVNDDADVWGHVCFMCNTPFGTRYDLLKHYNAPRVEEFACDVEGCDLIFSSQFQLRKHFDSAHPNTHAFQCDECDKVYDKQASLIHHKYVMHDERSNFHCDQCDKTFHRKTFWKEHMNSHYGIKTYQCPHCESAFARRTGLQAHLRKHTGIIFFIGCRSD